MAEARSSSHRPPIRDVARQARGLGGIRVVGAEINLEKLASRTRDRETAGNRRLAVTLGVERWRQKGTPLAMVLNKNPDVVSWWVGEGVRRQEDEEFAARLEMLDNEMPRLLVRGE